MGAILKGLQNLFDLIKTLVTFVVDLVKDLLYLVTELPKTVGLFTGGLMDFFPTVLASAVLVALSVLILLRIIGRDK